MKFLISLALLICSQSLFAQIDIGTKWYYNQSSFGPPPIGAPDSTRILAITKDTLINGIRYLKMEGTCACDDLQPDPSFYLIREEGRRVYYYWENEEHLLYDFNLEEGEVLRIYWPLHSNINTGNKDSLRLRIDSVSTWPNPFGAPSKVQYLSPLEGFEYYVDWGYRFIEGVGGSLFECFTPQWGLCESGTYPLLCYENSQGDITKFTTGSCIISSSEEVFVEEKLIVFPNPSSGLINIEVSHFEVATILVSDVMGRTLRKIEKEQGAIFQIDLKNEAAGVYLIRALDRDGEVLGLRKVLRY